VGLKAIDFYVFSWGVPRTPACNLIETAQRKSQKSGFISPTATLLEHTLLAQGLMGVLKVAFPRRLQLRNRDSTGANLSNAIKRRCRVR
jgi:hypothetical protein